MKQKFKIDFYREHKLRKPVVGLVSKVTKPKGMRKQESSGLYSYRLNTELISCYMGTPTEITEGLYWIMNITHNNDNELVWNQYLFIVDSDGDTYPVFEALEQEDTFWVKDALPVVKGYFNEEELEVIEVTHYKQPKKSKKWAV